MNIKLASTYGFCSGVRNALKIVDETLEKYPDQPIYLLNKLVHNNDVITGLKNKGITVLDNDLSNEDKIKSISKGVIIFSAHGHDKRLDDLAKSKNLITVDAVCPRVLLNHQSINKCLSQNKTVVYIGIKNHPETTAALSISDKIIFVDFKNPDYSLLKKNMNVVIHNQTTLVQSLLNDINNEIIKRVNTASIVNDICYATSKRQNCLEEVTDEDLIIIIGDKISSNSTRLYEVAKSKFKNADVYQVSSLDEVKRLNLTDNKKGFITAGASTPDSVINPIVDYLKLI